MLMIKICSLMLISGVLSGALLSTARLLGVKRVASVAKLSPFECGFNPYMNSRGSFSLQFFLVCMIFIVFDIELILLFPLISPSYAVLSGTMLIMYAGVFSVLTMGLIMEWNQQMLNWVV